MSMLPTWSDIFYVAAHFHSKPHDARCWSMLRAIEDAGHGDSVERELLNLALNYGFSRTDLKARVLDMLYGTHIKMYSYQGWDTLTTSTTKPRTWGEEE